MRTRLSLALAMIVAVSLASGLIRSSPSLAAPPPPSDSLAPRSVAAEEPISEYRLAPELRDRAERHAHVRHLQYVVDLVWSLLVLLLVLRLRLAARLQTFAERSARRRFVQVAIFAPLFLLTLAVLSLPTGIWAHATERSFGLSVQGWGGFARDWAVTQLLTLLLGTFLVWILYSVMRRSPRRWWLWTWVALLPVLLFVVFIEPFVVEPLFFKFTPLQDRSPALVERLRLIAERRGEAIPPARMFEMHASEKLRSVNAYVTGLGASKRVVVWDTTLQAMSEREIAFVFGHELGHYVLGHVVIGLGAGAAGLLLALFVGARVAASIVRRRGARLGIAQLQDLSSLPLLLLILSLLTTVATPIGAAFSRRLEHQADAFGLDAIEGVIPDPRQAAAHAFQRLGEIDLSEPDPGPLVVFWLYDHPAIRDRIAFVVGRR
jgi:Zn-dependent protease with chaperone function